MIALGKFSHFLPVSVFVSTKDNNYVIGSVWTHIRYLFDDEAKYWWDFLGGYLCCELLILLYWYRLLRFHFTEAVVLLGVSIKPHLMIIWWGGEYSLERLQNAYFESFGVYKGIKILYNCWLFLGEWVTDFSAWGKYIFLDHSDPVTTKFMQVPPPQSS